MHFTRAKGKDMARRGRPPAEKLTVDVDWFLDKMKERGINRTELASIIGQNRSAITRSFQGGRMLNARDVARVAEALHVDVSEVLRRIGVPVQPRGPEIVGTLLGDGRVSAISPLKGTAARVPGVPLDASALVADTIGTPLAPYHQATIIYAPSPAGAAPDSFGRLCVLEIEGQTAPVLGVIGRGRERGQMLVTVFMTGEVLTAARIFAASPVHAIIFP